MRATTVLLILLAVLSLSVINSIDPGTHDKACVDFNHGAALAAQAGLEDVYVCPADGIARIICSESYETRNVSSVNEAVVELSDVVFYMLMGPNSHYDAFVWWLPLIKSQTDIAVVADPCPNTEGGNFYGVGNMEDCDDAAARVVKHLQSNFPLITAHIVRVKKTDVGYNILSCKLRTGAMYVYKHFPQKKYYFKIDTDTIVFPRRFLQFLRTLSSVTEPTSPVYFGTVVESGMGLLLCGREWTHEGNVDKGGLCYGQGGAGYGLNNVGMQVLSSSPECNPATPDYSPEDTYVALRMFHEKKANVIHCGGFSSSEIMTDRRLRSSITFHYIDSKWLRQWGDNLLSHYHHHEHGGSP